MNVLLELENFFNSYKGKKQIIGRSERGKPLYCFDVKKSERPVVIAQYAIHAREYITTYLAIEQIRYFNRYGRRGRVLFIPALNPDGIEICREKRDELDEMIGRHSNAWRPDRIAPVSRNLLRLCVYEMLFEEDVPTAVAINEAVELTKKFDEPRAKSLVNGILNGIKNELEAKNPQ